MPLLHRVTPDWYRFSGIFWTRCLRGFLQIYRYLFHRFYEIQCEGSVTSWCRSGSPDPYLWLIDPDPDPTPDPTPFFIDLKNAKKYLFSYFFLITCPGTSSSVYFLLKFCVKILFCRHYFNPLNTFMRKGKDPDPDTYLWQMDSDPGGLKTCGSCRSWSPTLRNLLTDLSFKTTTYKRVSGSLRNVTIG